MSVLEAVDRDLMEIAKRDKALADSSIAATARVLAAELDDGKNSATSKSMCAKALREAMDRLLELTPAKKEGDRVDELKSRRERRVGGAGA